MSSVRVFTICLAILLSAGVVAADNPTYQKGTLIVATAAGNKSYNLRVGAQTLSDQPLRRFPGRTGSRVPLAR